MITVIEDIKYGMFPNSVGHKLVPCRFFFLRYGLRDRIIGLICTMFLTWYQFCHHSYQELASCPLFLHHLGINRFEQLVNQDEAKVRRRPQFLDLVLDKGQIHTNAVKKLTSCPKIQAYNFARPSAKSKSFCTIVNIPVLSTVFNFQGSIFNA